MACADPQGTSLWSLQGGSRMMRRGAPCLLPALATMGMGLVPGGLLLPPLPGLPPALRGLCTRLQPLLVLGGLP